MYKMMFFAIEFIILFLVTPLSSFATYIYWVTYKDTTYFGPNGEGNMLFVFSKDSANVNIDGNDTLLQGNYCHILRKDKFQEGSKIVSDVPLQIWYHYAMSDWGAYEDGALSYEILPQRLLGNNYWLPLSTTELVILATADGTVVQVGANNYNLNEGETKHILNPSIGVHITSNNAISVVAVNYGTNCYDNTYAFPLYPENLLDTVYFIPHQHSYNYNNSTDSSKVWVVATQNNTTVNFVGSQNLNQGDVIFFSTALGGKLTADKPVGIVWLSDVYAQDPWRSDYRHYTYAITPISKKIAGNKAYIEARSRSSHGYPRIEVFITSLEDNNAVNFDVNGDGIIEDTKVLDRGDTLYYHEEDFPGWDTSFLLIEGNKEVQITLSGSGWWSGIAEARCARTLIGVDYSPVGIEDKQEKVVTSFEIQIFPNPFSRYVNIKYTLNVSSEIKIAVYDITGKLVKVLRDDYETTGKYYVIWNREDKDGKKVPPGIYFCRFEGGGFNATRKLTILQ